jgi:hypothetical protein
MSTLELENIKHPDNAGNNITLAADGSLGTTTFTGGPVTVNNTSLTLKSQGEVGPFMYRSGGAGNDIRFYASNGTIASPTAKTNGQNVGQIHFHPHDGTTYQQVGSILAYMAGNATTGNTPVGLKFYTGSTTNNLSMAINENGHVTTPQQPSFRAGASGTNTRLPVTDAIVVLNGTTWNIGGHFNTATSTFTAPINGTYCFSYQATLTWATGGGGTYNAVYLKVNGGLATTRVRSIPLGTNQWASHIASWQVYLSANDAVTVWEYAQADNQVDRLWNETSFQGFLLG